MVATYGRANRSHLRFTLTEGGHPITTDTVDASAIADGSWVRVPVAIDRCLGRRLELRLSADDARPDDAVTAWTYPRYYDGATTQAGDAALDGRSLALSLNAFRLGILP
jgi:hypothetical protein